MENRLLLAEYLESRGISARDGYDLDDFQEWCAVRRAYREYERLRPMREAQEARWERQKHESVLEQAQRWAGDKVAGFVVFVGEFASSIHRDKAEAQEVARAQNMFSGHGVKIKRIKV